MAVARICRLPRGSADQQLAPRRVKQDIDWCRIQTRRNWLYASECTNMRAELEAM